MLKIKIVLKVEPILKIYIFLFQFTECMIIGRDLVRLLLNVARIPEFEKLWRDMYSNPSSLAPTFTGMYKQIYGHCTIRNCIEITYCYVFLV